jgi:Uma2 family endonuclease
MVQLLKEYPRAMLSDSSMTDSEWSSAIVRGNHHDFRTRHPSGQECRLVIEVADTSIDRDRAKAEIYRSSGVEEYWIVNINDRSVERYQFVEGSQTHQPSILPANTHLTIRISDTELVLDLGVIFNKS